MSRKARQVEITWFKRIASAQRRRKTAIEKEIQKSFYKLTEKVNENREKLFGYIIAIDDVVIILMQMLLSTC